MTDGMIQQVFKTFMRQGGHKEYYNPGITRHSFYESELRQLQQELIEKIRQTVRELGETCGSLDIGEGDILQKLIGDNE